MPKTAISDGVRTDPSACVPLTGRLRLYVDRRLGVGNFLELTHRAAPATDRPFLFAQRPGADRPVVEPFSLDDLVRVRDTYASWYHRAGVRKGDPVGVYVDEGIDSFLQYLALSALGAVTTLVNGRMPAAVAADYLDRVGVVGVVAGGGRRLALAGSAWVADAAEIAGSGPAGDLPAVYPYPHGDDDPVMLCHTSGTTGPPKAATFGHRQFFLGKRHRLLGFPAAAENRMLSALPHSHSAGISYLMTATLLGLPTLVMADPGGLAVHDAMGAFQPTIVVGFAQTWAELSQLPLDPAATSRVHTWINTGDSAHEAHIRALIRHGRRPNRRGGRPGSRFVDGLGSSEMGMALFRKVSEPESTDYGRCVGTPIAVVEKAAVLDDDGRQLGPHRVGRLGVRTPTRTPGYWNGSALTAKSTLSGFWLTGDVVYRDGKGRFFHLDRVPDVIRTAAGPVYSLPMEEAILVACDEIADCAVFAVAAPGPETGHVPYAIAVLKPGAAATADLTATLNAALAARDLPALRGSVVAREPGDLPTGATGKVLKRQLREQYADVLRRTDHHPTTEKGPR